MVNSTDSISVYRQIFNIMIRPNMWLPYIRARGSLKNAIKALVFYIILMLLVMTLGSISVNLLKSTSSTTLADFLINPTLAMHIVGSFITFIVMSVVFIPIFLLIAKGADVSLTLKRVSMVYFYAYADIFLVKCIELFVLSFMSILVQQ